MHTRNIGKGREKRRKKLKSMRRWERDGREEKVQGKCKGREGKEREEKRKKERFWILDDTGNLSMHVFTSHLTDGFEPVYEVVQLLLL